jgi:hypothetical protein
MLVQFISASKRSRALKSDISDVCYHRKRLEVRGRHAPNSRLDTRQYPDSVMNFNFRGPAQHPAPSIVSRQNRATKELRAFGFPDRNVALGDL